MAPRSTQSVTRLLSGATDRHCRAERNNLVSPEGRHGRATPGLSLANCTLGRWDASRVRFEGGFLPLAWRTLLPHGESYRCYFNASQARRQVVERPQEALNTRRRA